MKLPSALIVAVLAGAATFVWQQEIQASPGSTQLGSTQLGSAQLGSAQSSLLGDQVDSAGPGWRPPMGARGSADSVDETVASLTKDLDLTPGQSARIKPILEARQGRIRNLREIAPAILTREEFVARAHQISAETQDQVTALLTGRQRELVQQLRTPARS